MPHKTTYLDRIDDKPVDANDMQYNSVIGMCNRLLRAQIDCGKCCGECENKCEPLQAFIDFKPEGEQK